MIRADIFYHMGLHLALFVADIVQKQRIIVLDIDVNIIKEIRNFGLKMVSEKIYIGFKEYGDHMDEFKKAQTSEIAVGGYKCPCCSPVGGKKRSVQKRKLHKLARTRIKRITKQNATNCENDIDNCDIK